MHELSSIKIIKSIKGILRNELKHINEQLTFGINRTSSLSKI